LTRGLHCGLPKSKLTEVGARTHVWRKEFSGILKPRKILGEELPAKNAPEDVQGMKKGRGPKRSRRGEATRRIVPETRGPDEKYYTKSLESGDD